MNDAKYIVQSDHREMKVNVRIFRDIDELKIWGNELGFRFLRDPEDKTKYRVLPVSYTHLTLPTKRIV